MTVSTRSESKARRGGTISRVRRAIPRKAQPHSRARELVQCGKAATPPRGRPQGSPLYSTPLPPLQRYEGPMSCNVSL